MIDRQDNLIPVVQRPYDPYAGLYEHMNRFPDAQRILCRSLQRDRRPGAAVDACAPSAY